MSGVRWMGDNPLGTYSPTFSHICFPLFTTDILCGDSIKTTFSPLLIASGPVFLVLCFPAKKGVLSITAGE